MTIQSLRLSGFRGYIEPQLLELAQPDGNPGSGITIVVGPNNAGKSTLIEAFRVMATNNPTSFSEAVRNHQAEDRVSIKLTSEEGTFELRTVLPGGSESEWVPDSGGDHGLFVLPARRSFPPFFSRGDPYGRDRYMLQGALQQRSEALGQFATRLFRAQQQRDEFNEVFKKVIDPPPQWYIEQGAQGSYYLKFETGGLSHNSEGLGEGIVSLLFIVDALYDSLPNQTIVVDEPELSLHPALQRRLMALLKAYSADRQVVYATHSPYFVDFEALASGAHLTRVQRSTQGIRLRAARHDVVDEIAPFGSDANNPHTLGLDAREVFFLEDPVVLVEGQEDVLGYRALFRHFGRELDASFFGWGVGGAEKMERVARLLSTLGFERVVGILDADKTQTADRLRQEFPSYSFMTTAFDDVRDKPARAVGAKSGLLNTDLSLKPELREVGLALINQIDGLLHERHDANDRQT